MTLIDLAAIRPDAAQVELVAGLLAEVDTASVAGLSADLRLPLITIAAALRVLERSGRAQRSPTAGTTSTPGRAPAALLACGRDPGHLTNRANPWPWADPDADL